MMCCSSLVEVEVWPGGGASVGGVAELVDVEAVQPRLQVADLAGDTHRIATGWHMLKRDGCTSIHKLIIAFVGDSADFRIMLNKTAMLSYCSSTRPNFFCQEIPHGPVMGVKDRRRIRVNNSTTKETGPTQ